MTARRRRPRTSFHTGHIEILSLQDEHLLVISDTGRQQPLRLVRVWHGPRHLQQRRTPWDQHGHVVRGQGHCFVHLLETALPETVTRREIALLNRLSGASYQT